MLTLPSAAIAHLEQDARRLTICGVITKNDGSILRCTQHDEDLDIDDGEFAGYYSSAIPVTGSDVKTSSDMSVDNMEVQGFCDASFSGFTVPDIEAGLFAGAPFEVFICQWDDANAWQKVIRRGYIGEISRTAEGQFTAEWRGIFQLFQQNIGRTYGERCDVVKFGDARCGLDVSALSRTGTVTTVTSRKRFNATISGGATAAGYFNTGELAFTSGANEGFIKQVKLDNVGGTVGHFELWEGTGFDVQVGDAFTVKPGCDRRFETCQAFSNQINFRGHGLWIPGIPKIMRAP